MNDNPNLLIYVSLILIGLSSVVTSIRLSAIKVSIETHQCERRS